MKNIIFLLLALLIFFSSCEDMEKEVNWKVDEIPARLVVQGEVTDELKQHVIRLTESDTYFANRAPEPVSNAQVTVNDGETEYIFEENLDLGAGYYESVIAFSGSVGKTYRLNIELAESLNGVSSYYAQSTMHENMVIDSMYAFQYKNPFVSENDEEETDTTILVLTVFGSEPAGEGDYYVLDLMRNQELVTNLITSKGYIHDESAGLEDNTVFTFAFEEEFFQNDTVTLEVRSSDETFHQYMEGLNQISQPGDPLGLSGPPANAVGNIEGGQAQGYFKASSVTWGYALVIEDFVD